MEDRVTRLKNEIYNLRRCLSKIPKNNTTYQDKIIEKIVKLKKALYDIDPTFDEWYWLR